MSLNLFEETTDGIRLPHPPISLRSLLVFESALCAAWQLMRNKPRAIFNLATSTEDEVTHELHERLYNEVFDKGVVAGFDRNIFAAVIREPKIRNFNGTNLDKMPDLFAEFVDRPAGVLYSQHGIFTECKPVDAAHTVGTHYCDKGIIRFIRGDYAWTMPNALMVGYACKGYTISPKLPDALATRAKAIPTLDTPKPCKKSQAGPANEVVHISQHERTFKYVETGKAAPAITIRHLWLKRD
jgi:hypothetical protein